MLDVEEERSALERNAQKRLTERQGAAAPSEEVSTNKNAERRESISNQLN